jgi:hypothetical protein
MTAMMTRFGDLSVVARQGVERFERHVREEWTRAEIEALDEAHLATLGDRLFLGCEPGAATPPEVLMNAAANPTAGHSP